MRYRSPYKMDLINELCKHKREHKEIKHYTYRQNGAHLNTYNLCTIRLHMYI